MSLWRKIGSEVKRDTYTFEHIKQASEFKRSIRLGLRSKQDLDLNQDMLDSVSDLDSLSPNPCPAFFSGYRSGSRLLMTLKNIFYEKNDIFLFKIAIYLSLGFRKGRPSYRRSLQPSKENIQHLKTWNFLTFSIFVGYFFPPEPDPLTWLNPDPKHWYWDP